MIKVLVIDDEYFVRVGIRETIDWEAAGVTLVGDADNGETGLQLAKETGPDVVITDIRMPTMDGLEFMKRCREEGLSCEFIVLSAHDEFDYAKTAMQQGASDYLLKPVSNEQLMQAVLNAGKAKSRKREVDEYYKTLSDGLSQVKEQAVADILTNVQMSRDELAEKLALFQIELAADGNYVVLIRIQEYHLALQRLTPAGLKDHKSHMLQLAKQHILPQDDQQKNLSNFLVRIGDREVAVLLHIEDDKIGGRDPAEEIKTRCLRFARALAQDDGLQVAVGISLRFDRTADLPAAYQQAFMASHKNLLPSENSVAYYGDDSAVGYRRTIVGALDYIRENYEKDITVESIAEALYISASHLMHLFRGELGKTVNECLTEYRIEAAKNLLRDSKLKMLDISQQVGYKNEKYFTRVFKKATGLSPSEYARLNR